jgi:hypothetical protein
MSTIDRSAMAKGWHALTLLGAYGVLVAILTWPLVAHVATHHPWVIPVGDWYHMTWTLAWETHALTTAPSAFAQANVFYPTRDALFYGPAGIGALPLFAPVFLLSANPVLASNATLLIGFMLTGWGLHSVVRGWTGSHLAGLVAAITFFNSTFVRLLPPSAPQYAALLYFPWILWLSSQPTLPLGRALLLALLIALQCLADTVYVAPAVIAPLGVLTAILLARRATRARGRRLAAVLVLALLSISPVYLAYIRVMSRNPLIGEQTTSRLSIEAPPLSMILQLGAFSLTPLTLVLCALGLVALLLHRAAGTDGVRRAVAQGALWFAVCAPLSLRATARWGDEVIRLPLGYLQDWLPVLARLRVPDRVGIGSLMGLAVLAGVAFSLVEAWLRARAASPRCARVAAVALAALVGSAAFLQDRHARGEAGLIPSARVDARLLPALRAGTEPMVVLPSTILTNSRAMFQSIDHWRPLLNGYSSYWPLGFSERMELASRLPQRGAVDELVRETGVSLVWLNLRRVGRSLPAWERAIRRGRFRLLARTDEVWLLRAAPRLPSSVRDPRRPSPHDP